ncbi:MAG: hypothetical protein IKO55_18760 [Kiritimatiellae bacterium]|nr:hypothetical protein [Kiritimatiellia bacterium]
MGLTCRALPTISGREARRACRRIISKTNRQMRKVREMANNESADLERAIEVVRTTGRASLTWLQRKLNIGYQEAARLIDQLEERGIIGPAREDGPREILLP